MAIKLIKACKVLNIGMRTLLAFCEKKGRPVPADPNCRLSDSTYLLLAREFKPEIAERLEAEGVVAEDVYDNTGMPVPVNHGKPWDKEQEEELCRLADNGKLLGEIARRLGRTVHSIEMKLEALGYEIYIPEEESPENSWPHEDEEKLRQLIVDHVGIDEVCEALGRNTETVEEKMKELGIEYAEDNQTDSSIIAETPNDGDNDEIEIEEEQVKSSLLSEEQAELAERLLSVVPENGISKTDLIFQHAFDREELSPILDILREQGVLRFDRYNNKWFIQDRKVIKDELHEKQPAIDPVPSVPQENTVESVHDIVLDSKKKLERGLQYRIKEFMAARYRVTRNKESISYWLISSENVPIPTALSALKNNDATRVAYRNSLMGIRLQTAKVGDDFSYQANAGQRDNHLHNAHIIHTREIQIENEKNPYNYRGYATLDEYLKVLQQNLGQYEEKVALIEEKVKARQDENLTPQEKGQLTRDITKLKEETRQLAGQRDDLLYLSSYIREQGKLRYNPVLDRKQTQIKTEHLYDGVPLVIDGGPGTGKTTTMIQRLKYLTDVTAIEEDDKDKYNRYKLSATQRTDLFERIKNNHDWIFFSPSQLLKSYLADAMNRDGLVATNEKVWDWSEFRKHALRDYGFFGIGKSFPFADCSESDELIYSEAAPRKQFIDFLKESICRDVAQLPTIESTHMVGMSNNARRIVRELDGIERDTLQGIIRRLFLLQEIQLEKTIDVESEIEQLTSILENEIVQNQDLVDLLSEIQLQSDDIEFERADDDKQSDLHFLLKNWLFAYCYNRFYPSEEHSDEYNDILGLIQDVVKQIDAARLNRIGNGFIYERYNIFTKGVYKIILQRLPRYYKEFRKHIIEQNNTDEWNLELLKRIIKKNKKQLHFQEQALLLLITNDLIGTINKIKPNSIVKNHYVETYNDLVRPIIGIDEVTDFSEVEIQAIVSFKYIDYNAITMAGDLMQRMTGSGIKSWDALDNAIQHKEVKELRTSYRQSKRMLEVAQQLYEDTIGESPNYKAHLVESRVPRPIMCISESEDRKVQWIENRIAEVYQAYSKHMPATAIFLNSKEDVKPFVDRMRESSVLQGAGIEIVDGTEGNVLGSRQQIRVYPINVVKGLEFDVVFFHNIDSAGFDDDTIKRYIYVGVSRAAFFLGATMTHDIPAISQYFSKKKNWRDF